METCIIDINSVSIQFYLYSALYKVMSQGALQQGASKSTRGKEKLPYVGFS